ncbi:MAG: hypothetical protein FJ126_01750 [Deltaproteobacteria bacterium]|nr:hypothetical protein [Deltaproteobacteria bacterium]
MDYGFRFSVFGYFLLRGCLGLALIFLAGCAEVTRPRPAAPEVEAAQLAAARRHPHYSWAMDRVSRVFIRLLAVVPQMHGRTYPFLGFNWWVTETGKVAVDHVWRPSPAHDAGMKAGDLILAVNNWPLPAWVGEWNRHIRTTRTFLKDFVFVIPVDRKEARTGAQSPAQRLVMLPGELLPAFLEDVKHAGMEAQGRYVSGPVDLLVMREEEKFTLRLYPQHLPAEYGILINPTDYQVNAYAGHGRVILTQRLVNFCLNDHEIALVVGHELAHQTQGHLVRGALHRELGKFVGEAVLAFATLSLPRLLDWRYVAVDPEVRRVAQEAVVSVFSRDDEREADAYGLWYAFQAGYDVDAAPAFWERVAGVVEKDPFTTTYYLSAHPASLERLARLKRINRYFKAGRAAEVFLQTPDLDRQPPPQ